MIRNYIKIAWRNLVKEKTMSGINLVGLSLAFACSILLFLTANFHFSFDDFHTHKNEIFKLYKKVNRPEKTEYGSSQAPPVAPALKAEYPEEIVAATRIMDGGMQVIYNNKNYDLDINYVDPDYYQIFTQEFLSGAPSSALNETNSLVLGKKDAIKIFGKTDVVGETVETRGKRSFIITAVVDDTPKNSSIKLGSKMRFDTYPGYQEAKESWDWSNHNVYIRLAEKIDPIKFELGLKAFTEKYYKGDIEFGKESGMIVDDRGEVISTRLLPILEEHFNTDLGTGSIKSYYPYLLLGIGLLILLIASINFINLSIVRSLVRAKEVGMRKSLGASKKQVVFQFWGEALLICVIALFVGLCASYLLIPEFNSIIDGEIEFSLLLMPKVILTIIATFLLVSIFAGGYPAMIVAKFNTVEVLKGKVKKGLSKGGLRNGLIVVQFSIAVMLITCTLLIWKQINHLRNMPLGFDQAQVISIPVPRSLDGYRVLNHFRNELRGQNQVLSITGADDNLGKGKDGSGYRSVFGFSMDGKEYLTNGMNVDFDYVETLGLELIEGRSFDRKFSTDSSQACIINERMAKQLGGKDLIGKNLALENGLNIIGIVKDFHFESLHQEVESQTLFFNPSFGINYIFVKVANQEPLATMNLLEKTLKSFSPDAEFIGSFLKENTDAQYKKEERISKIFISAALMAILLSCIGLFAIALMVIRQRTKEVGLRKVLGASTQTLVSLLSRDFIILVFVAMLIGFPMAYYAMTLWLAEFPFRIEIGWVAFGVAGTLALTIAFLTVGFHAYRAANMNPVESIKSE
ncbi:MacB-like core domain-containing protein [Spirosomataceae bacterium TFI 002]|nr:MacB-like core domain-containing protein [Spirosomataceae bacterium TFI 002]